MGHWGQMALVQADLMRTIAHSLTPLLRGCCVGAPSLHGWGEV
jgi:hypothetical protein